jgi:hypothetical protein
MLSVGGAVVGKRAMCSKVARDLWVRAGVKQNEGVDSHTRCWEVRC